MVVSKQFLNLDNGHTSVMLYFSLYFSVNLEVFKTQDSHKAVFISWHRHSTIDSFWQLSSLQHYCLGLSCHESNAALSTAAYFKNPAQHGILHLLAMSVDSLSASPRLSQRWRFLFSRLSPLLALIWTLVPGCSNIRQDTGKLLRPSQGCTSGIPDVICPIIAGADFGHLVETVSANLLLWKTPLPPSMVVCGGHWDFEYCVSNIHPTPWDPPALPAESVDDVRAAEVLFSRPIFPFMFIRW